MNWINVKDRLPEIPNGATELSVLVYTDNGNWFRASYQVDNTWWISNSNLSLHEGEVTHWCEVTPPKELSRAGALAKVEATLRETGVSFTKVSHYDDKYGGRFVVHFDDKNTRDFPTHEITQAIKSGRLLEYLMSSI